MNEQMVKPEYDYQVKTDITYEELENAWKLKKTITGKVIRYNIEKKTLVVKLGNGFIGILPWKEATIYRFTNNKIIPNVPQQILALINRKIRIKIISISYNRIILSRKMNMKEAWEQICLNPKEYIYNAIIIGKQKCGIFYDIGEGITAFSHITETTSLRVDIMKWFNIGDYHKVVIIKSEEFKNYNITCSRKRVYMANKNYYAYNQFQIVDVILGNPVYDKQTNKLTGYYVEINPAVIGIADLPYDNRELKTGDVLKASIKSVDVIDSTIKLDLL